MSFKIFLVFLGSIFITLTGLGLGMWGLAQIAWIPLSFGFTGGFWKGILFIALGIILFIWGLWLGYKSKKALGLPFN
jgi:hypothetical protein